MSTAISDEGLVHDSSDICMWPPSVPSFRPLVVPVANPPFKPFVLPTRLAPGSGCVEPLTHDNKDAPPPTHNNAPSPAHTPAALQPANTNTSAPRTVPPDAIMQRPDISPGEARADINRQWACGELGEMQVGLAAGALAPALTRFRRSKTTRPARKMASVTRRTCGGPISTRSARWCGAGSRPSLVGSRRRAAVRAPGSSRRAWRRARASRRSWRRCGGGSRRAAAADGLWARCLRWRVDYLRMLELC